MPKHISTANFHYRLAKNSLISQIEINYDTLTLLVNEPLLSKPRNEFAPFFESLKTKNSPFKSAKVVKFVQDPEKEHATLHFNDNFDQTIQHMHIKFDRPIDDKILIELADWFDKYQSNNDLRKKDQENRLPAHAVKYWESKEFNVKDPFISARDGEQLLKEFASYSANNDQCFPICTPYNMFHSPRDQSVNKFCFGKPLPSSRQQGLTFSASELAIYFVLAIVLLKLVSSIFAEKQEENNAKAKKGPLLKR